jgi:hypothetical protein
MLGVVLFFWILLVPLFLWKRPSNAAPTPDVEPDDATARVQILFCELDGEASLIDCVTMHPVDIGDYTLPAAAPLSLVALETTEQMKHVLQAWADAGACVEAGFSYEHGDPRVHLRGTDTTIHIGLAGALA